MKLSKKDFVKFCDYHIAYKITDEENRLEETNKIVNVISTWDIKNAQGFMGEKDGVLYVSHMGANEGIDWLFNVRFFLKKVPYNGTNPKIKVHTGFINMYKLVRKKLHEKLGNYNKIIVSGSSLGAALATLCAVDLQYNFPDRDISCIISGSPRVGNTYFSESYNRRVPDTYRFVYQDDLFPKLPFRKMAGFGKNGYTHVSEKIYLGKEKRWWRFFSIRDHWIDSAYSPAIRKMEWEGV